MTAKDDQSVTEEVRFIARRDAIYVVWRDGKEECVGHTVEEIVGWWHDLLAKFLNTQIGSPAYDEFVDRAFGGD